MILENTAGLMRAGLASARFGSYAVLVCMGDTTAFVTSPDVGPDTYFDIASMGKALITAPLILRAVGEGRISLDDTLDRFFVIPECPDKETKKHITISQLLTHTSGIVRIPLSPEAAAKGNDALAEQIISNPLAYTPGTKYVYSCNAYILLGFIAEKIYGAPLDRLFEKYIKEPLGLTRSRFNIALDEPDAVISYRWREPGKYRVDDENVQIMGGIAGSGANFWTLRDIDVFCKAVMERSGKLWAPYLYDLAEKDYTPGAQFEEGRGLGWLVVDKRYTQTGRLFPEGSFGHCGHTGCSMYMSRERDLRVIILTNATRYANMANDFHGYDYGKIEKMREEIHNAIADDLGIN